MATESARPADGRGGFTLIEVLIAMVILAVGLLALEAMAIGASRSIAAANRMTEYTLIASQQLETVLEQARTPTQNAPTSTTRVLANGTTVQTDVVPNAQGAAGTLYTVTVTVTPATSSSTSPLTPTRVIGRVLR